MADHFADWKEAHAVAQQRANETGLDVAIRKASPYDREGFVVSFASRNDSDYATAEIVKPERSFMNTYLVVWPGGERIVKAENAEAALLYAEGEPATAAVITETGADVARTWIRGGRSRDRGMAMSVGTASKKDICIVDRVGGGRFPTSFWADWDGKKVVFGGDWRDVPDMPAKREPTEKRVYAWAHKHGGLKIGVPSNLSAVRLKYAEGSSRLSGVFDQARQHFEQAGIAPTEEEILAYIAEQT